MAQQQQSNGPTVQNNLTNSDAQRLAAVGVMTAAEAAVKVGTGIDLSDISPIVSLKSKLKDAIAAVTRYEHAVRQARKKVAKLEQAVLHTEATMRLIAEREAVAKRHADAIAASDKAANGQSK